MWECRDREINPAAFTKLHLPRECIRYSPKLRFGLWPEFFHVALCDAFLKSAKTRWRFVISVFPLVPRHDETFSPTRNLPTTMRLATGLACRASRPVYLFSLIALSFLTLNSRLPHYPVSLSPLAPFPSFPATFLHFERYTCFPMFFFPVL